MKTVYDFTVKVISFLVFAVLYALVYKKTSNTYYKIVSK